MLSDAVVICSPQMMARVGKQPQTRNQGRGVLVAYLVVAVVLALLAAPHRPSAPSFLAGSPALSRGPRVQPIALRDAAPVLRGRVRRVPSGAPFVTTSGHAGQSEAAASMTMAHGAAASGFAPVLFSLSVGAAAAAVVVSLCSLWTGFRPRISLAATSGEKQAEDEDLEGGARPHRSGDRGSGLTGQQMPSADEGSGQAGEDGQDSAEEDLQDAGVLSPDEYSEIFDEESEVSDGDSDELDEEVDMSYEGSDEYEEEPEAYDEEFEEESDVFDGDSDAFEEGPDPFDEGADIFDEGSDVVDSDAEDAEEAEALPFPCALCSSGYRREENLLRHMAYKHGIPPERYTPFMRLRAASADAPEPFEQSAGYETQLQKVGRGVSWEMERLRPHPQQIKKWLRLYEQLYWIVTQALPDAKLFVFGSVAQGTCTVDSDIDFCVLSGPDHERLMRRTKFRDDTIFAIRRVLARRGMGNTLVTRSRWRAILKFRGSRAVEPFDVGLEFVPVRNSAFIRRYVAQHRPLLQPLLRVVNRWSKSAGINGADRGWLNTYAFTLMALHYALAAGAIQHQSPDTLPHEYLEYNPLPRPREARDPDFALVARTLIGFFDYYGYEFDAARHVVHLRPPGDPVTKASKGWTHAVFTIEDPMEPDSNAGRLLSEKRWLWTQAHCRVASHLLRKDYTSFFSGLAEPAAPPPRRGEPHGPGPRRARGRGPTRSPTRSGSPGRRVPGGVRDALRGRSRWRAEGTFGSRAPPDDGDPPRRRVDSKGKGKGEGKGKGKGKGKGGPKRKRRLRGRRRGGDEDEW